MADLGAPGASTLTNLPAFPVNGAGPSAAMGDGPVRCRYGVLSFDTLHMTDFDPLARKPC